MVKNVAGFDLVRLLTGSWGTLAFITEVSVRLHALPQREESFVVYLAAGSLDSRLAELRGMPVSTMALQLVDAGAASALLGEPVSSPALLVRVGGNGASVHAHRGLLSQLGEAVAVDDQVWTRFREIERLKQADDVPFVFRASMGSAKVSALFNVLTSAASQSRPAVRITASPLDGVVRVVGFHPTTASALIDAATKAGARVIGERLSPADWNRLPAPLNAIAEGIRNRFDPRRIVNRGMFDTGNGAHLAPSPSAPSTARTT